jgi:pimeloyl-ACP methyl ester carboxylesterase
LHVTSSGAGEPLLFLHGFPDHGACWNAQMKEFSPVHLVAAPDGRGHGRSDCPTDPALYAIDTLVGDILAVADHLGAARFTLIGHDWGGVVAWFAAAMHPERVERLIAINAPHPTLFQARLEDDEQQRAASSYIARLTAPDVESSLTPELLWQATFGEAEALGLVSAAERAEMLSCWSRPGALSAMLNWYRAAPFDFRPVGGFGAGRPPGRLLIPIPVLVIWGDRDPLLRPSLLQGLDDLVPDLTVRRVADAGHGMVRERPDEVTALIRDYLSAR